MTKSELQTLNLELIELLVSIRDQIDEKLDELEAVAEADEEDGDSDDDEDSEAED